MDYDTPEIFEVEWGEVHVAKDDTGKLTITRIGKKDGLEGVEMVVFDPQDSIIQIFPREAHWKGSDFAYSQLKEIRVDRAVTSWNPDYPLGETDGGEYRLEGFPKGIGVVIGYGLSFPKNYKRLSCEIQAQTPCAVLYLTSQETQVVDDTFYLNIRDFNSYIETVDRHRDRASDIASRLNAAESFNVVDSAVKRPLKEVGPCRLPIKQAMMNVISGKTELDVSGREELLQKTMAETRAAADENRSALGRLRHDIDLVTLEVLIDRFDKELRRDGRSCEKVWQSFFKDNQFALQQLFSSPVTYIREQIEVRVSSLKGSGLRRPDFLMVNTISRIIHLIEIKRPDSEIMQRRSYRGRDGAEVYACGDDLNGSIAQLQSQIESARTDLRWILGNTPNVPPMNTAIVRGVVVVGMYECLDSQQKQSFDRYRDSISGIHIITYDEVLASLKNLHSTLNKVKSDE